MTHISMLGFALLLPYLSSMQALLCALAACSFNLFLLPKWNHFQIFRGSETKSVLSGPFCYSLSILILILWFPEHPYLVAASWAVMALGDGLAAVIGISFRRFPIPWNPDKTILGTAAFILFGSLGASGFLFWMLPRFPRIWLSPAEIIAISSVVTISCALIESFPWRVSDNLTVPLAAGAFFYLLIDTPFLRRVNQEGLWTQLNVGLLVNIFLALVGWFLSWVRVSGVLAGIILGTLIYGFQGWKGFSILLSFFVFGSLCTRLGYHYKRELGVSQSRKGARGAREALANGGLSAILAILAWATEDSGFFLIGFISALAAATADTVSSEIGQWLGGDPYLITHLNRVSPGTNGAVTVKGTLAGILATLAIGLIALQTGLIQRNQFWIVQVAGLIGNLMDSLLGATLEGKYGVDNELINFFNTLTGAGVGMTLERLLRLK